MGRPCNILIADDEKEIIKVLRLFLEKEGINVYGAYDGEMAYMVIKNYDIDLAILDIMMPRMNGYHLIQKIREEHEIPVMFLSAKVQLDDKVLGLDLGADDYITKPFEPLEVVARVKAHLRRRLPKDGADAARVLRVQDMTLNLDTCQLCIGEREVDLTRTELSIMELFMSYPGRVYTKEQLYECAWEDLYAVDDNTIRVMISRLREKIGADKIKTIRGLGYRLEK